MRGELLLVVSRVGRLVVDTLVVPTVVVNLVDAASRADQVAIVPGTSVQHVIALVPHENVIAGIAEQRILTLVATHQIRAVAAVQRHRRGSERGDLVIGDGPGER